MLAESRKFDFDRLQVELKVILSSVKCEYVVRDRCCGLVL